MKNRIQLLLILFLSTFSSLKAIDASVSFATFKGIDQSYVEIYLTIIGQTVDFQKVDSLNYQAREEVTLLFKQGDDIIKFDKYALNSPITTKTLDFMDVKRYALGNGTYTLDVSIRDLVDTTNVTTFSTPLVMNYEGEELLQSDIQLLSKIEKTETPSIFNKNGYYMEALPFNYCGRKMSIIHFYTEIYNADKVLNDDYLLSYFIEKVDGEGNGRTFYIGHKRRKSSPIDVVVLPLNLSDIPSGNYRLKVDIRDRNKVLISSKSTLFQRSNPYLDKDINEINEFDIANTFVADLSAEELRYSLKAIAPIHSTLEMERLNFIIASNEPIRQKNYLFNYWASQNANHPDQAYEAYMEVARAVDNKFKSGFGYGFETDRGHIFLKYGRPNEFIAVEDEPIAPPYEIWAYHRIDKLNQSNVKFIFYNPNNAAGDYELLHSNCRAEINNPQWQLELYRLAPDQIEGNDYLNGTKVKDGLNRQAARYFNDL